MSNPAQELERYVREMGFKALKLCLAYQCPYANDSMLYSLYAKAQELGIAIMIDTGSSIFSGARLKYGDLLYIDEVPVDFPELERNADRVVFGSDCPGLRSIGQNIEAIRSLSLAGDIKAKILGGNAGRLLNRSLRPMTD